MWQKARYVKTLNSGIKQGTEFWVLVGPPIPARGKLAAGPNKGKRIEYACGGYRTNHYTKNPNKGTIAKASVVELLPEFAEHVPMIPWSDFFEQATA